MVDVQLSVSDQIGDPTSLSARGLQVPQADRTTRSTHTSYQPCIQRVCIVWITVVTSPHRV